MRTCDKGAHSELIAAAWLMRQGHQVFRALSPAAPFDLVILNSAKQLLKVEVRSGKTGGPSSRYTGSYDLLLIVDENGEVHIR